MAFKVRVAPFTKVTENDLITQIDDETKFKTCFSVFYDCDADGRPDTRALARSDQSNVLDYLMCGIYAQATITAKSNSAYMPPPRSFVVMHRLNEMKWVFLVIVATAVATAKIIAKNLFGIMCPKPGSKVLQYVPAFMQTQLGFLQTLRCAINAADSPIPGIGPNVPTVDALRVSSNMTAYQVGFSEAVETMGTDVAEIISKHKMEKVLNPFIAFGIEKFINTHEHIANSSDFGDQLKNLISLLFVSNDGSGLEYAPTILEMSLDGIREMFSGTSAPPICLPDFLVDIIYKAAGVDIPRGVPYDTLVERLIDGADPRLKIDVSNVSTDERYLYPAWFKNMDYMARFGSDVKNGAPLIHTLRRAFQRMMAVSDETPEWITFAALNMATDFAAFDATCSDAGISRIEVESWRICGDHSGFCNRFAHIQFFIAGSFNWSGLPPAKLIINFNGPKGCGKSYEKSFFMDIKGLIPCVGKHAGSAKAEFVLRHEYHVSQDLHITMTDDTTIGIPVNNVIPADVKAVYKQMFDVPQNNETLQIRSVAIGASNKRQALDQTQQVQRTFAGAIILTNEQIFVTSNDDESTKAIQSRIVYTRMHKNGHISPSVVPSNEDKAIALRRVVYEMHVTTVVTLFQASLGIMPTCPLALEIFNFVFSSIRDLSGSEIDFTEQSRAYTRFTRTIAILATRAYVWRVISAGCDGEIETVCNIIHNGLHLVATPIECIQAAFLVLNGSHCSMPIVRLPEHDMLDVCADSGVFADDFFTVGETPFVKTVEAMGAATEISQGRFAINNGFLSRGVCEPSIQPNVLDVALASLVRSNEEHAFSCLELRKCVKNPVHLVPTFRLLCVYSKVNPEFITVRGNWLENIRTIGEIVASQAEIIVVRNMAKKLFSRPHPSIVPPLDSVCRKYLINRPFHVCTEENMESVSETTLPGNFYYTPPVCYSEKPIRVQVMRVGHKAQICNVPLDEYRLHEMWGSATSLGAASHRELHSYLPQPMLNNIPTARDHHLSVQGFLPYKSMESVSNMIHSEISYGAATGQEAVEILASL